MSLNNTWRSGCWWPLVVMGLAAAAFAIGCGDDDPDNGGDPKTLVIDVRNGVWEVKTVLHLPEGDSTIVDTSGLCFLDFSEVNLGDLEINCSGTDDGSSITYACGGSVSIPPCTIQLVNEGSGTYTETSFNVNSVTRGSVLGGELCEANYGAFVDTTEVTLIGTWLEAEPDTAITCSDDDAPEKGLRVRDLGLSGIGRALSSP